MKQIWIYDIEQYRNFHCCTFQTRDGTRIRQFVIHELKDDRISYKQFLDNEIDGLIGFNNLNYDGVILNYLYEIMDSFTPEEVNLQLYELSNTIISDEQTEEIKRIRRIKKWNQLDLYKIHHFDNKAKKSS